MSRKTTLIKNIFIYGVGTSLSKLLSILLVGLYTAYIAPEDFGYYDVLTVTVSALTPLITLQIIDALYRHLLEANSEEDSRRAVTCGFLIVVSGLVLAVSALTVINLLMDIALGWYLLPFIASTILFSFSQQTARGLRRNAVYALSGITYTGVMLGANLLLIVQMGLGVKALLLSIIIADVFGIFFIEFTVGVYRRIKFSLMSKKLLWEMCRYSIPLLPSAITWWILMLFSRYAILYAMGAESNGIFAASAKFPALLMTIYGIFALAWQENAILEYNAGDRNDYYTKTFKLYLRLLFCVVLVLLPMTHGFVNILIDKTYGEAWKYIPFLYLGSMFQAFSNFYLTAYMGAKKTKGAFVTSLVGVLCGVSVCFVTIPALGIQAASLGHMVSFFVIWITRVWDTRKYATIRMEKVPLIAFSLLTTLYVICYYMDKLWLNITLFLCSIPIFLWFNRDTMGLLLGLLRDTISKKKGKNL